MLLLDQLLDFETLTCHDDLAYHSQRPALWNSISQRHLEEVNTKTWSTKLKMGAYIHQKEETEILEGMAEGKGHGRHSHQPWSWGGPTSARTRISHEAMNGNIKRV